MSLAVKLAMVQIKEIGDLSLLPFADRISVGCSKCAATVEPRFGPCIWPKYSDFFQELNYNSLHSFIKRSFDY